MMGQLFVGILALFGFQTSTVVSDLTCPKIFENSTKSSGVSLEKNLRLLVSVLLQTFRSKLAGKLEMTKNMLN